MQTDLWFSFNENAMECARCVIVFSGSFWEPDDFNILLMIKWSGMKGISKRMTLKITNASMDMKVMLRRWKILIDGHEVTHLFLILLGFTSIQCLVVKEEILLVQMMFANISTRGNNWMSWLDLQMKEIYAENLPQNRFFQRNYSQTIKFVKTSWMSNYSAILIFFLHSKYTKKTISNFEKSSRNKIVNSTLRLVQKKLCKKYFGRISES